MENYILTSESVTEGHPDKVCDQISDAILDEYLKQDSNSRVAVECMISNGLLVVSGEVTSKGVVDIEKVAKNTLLSIGYSDYRSGFDVENSKYIINISKQSPDIAMGVNRDKICAGDQGMVYGYACDENSSYMPTPIYLAHKLTKRLAEVRKKSIIKGLLPDGKSQISIEYNKLGQIERIKSVVIASQHIDTVDIGSLRVEILEKVISKVIDMKYVDKETKFHINTTGLFTIGGPRADTGLTGRKIIVDTYGGIGRHGGGAYSGKDPSKSDRSVSYMARYIAKNIVAAGLASKCEVSLSYVIGKANAENIYINTFGTEKVSTESIEEAVKAIFDLSIDSIIKDLHLQKPMYLKTASYGHFGSDDLDFKWERIDKVDELLNYLKIK